MEEKLVCGLLFGEAENEKNAKNITKSYQDCPYINLIATRGKQVLATFFLPEKQTWWIKSIEDHPKSTFGLEKAEVIIAKDVQYPKQLKMRLPEKPKKISPCGANCGTCASYEKCLGCPATIFYKPRKQ
jgi:hypothetical protein